MQPSRHNLPIPLTSFVGRESELAQVLELLDAHRLVALTGVGGCGKTRLALRAAEELARRSPDGPWVVDLSSVTDGDLLPRLVAGAMDIMLEPGSDEVAGLAARLARRAVALVLDTCEHLLEPVAGFTDRLLRLCPGLTVLATTREPLGVEGELVWPVPGLEPRQARQLFVERAQLVAPAFVPDRAEDQVDEICSRVDRLPLAVELAAAWTRALTPRQISSGLEDSIGLLSGGPRGVAPRHRTLEASIRWSHRLLEPEESRLFRRLSVFSGTFTLEAVAAVCADVDAADVLPADWLRLLGRLLDKSLVAVREVNGELRYRLLDTIRQYAGQQLEDSGETRLVEERHLAYFVDLAERAESTAESDQDVARELVDSHLDNLRAALDRGLSGDDGNAGAAGRLAAALGQHWLVRGLSREGLGYLERALRHTEGSAVEPAVRHRLLAAQAVLAMVSARPDLLDRAATEVLAAADADPVSRARCLLMQGYPAFFRDFEECERIAHEAQAAGEEVADGFTRGWALVMQGYSYQTRCLHERALDAGRAGYEHSLRNGDRFVGAFARGIHILTTAFTGDVPGAVAVGRETIEIAQPLRDYFALGTNTVNAAHAVVLSGDLDEARAMIEPVVRSLQLTEDADVVGFMVSYALLHLSAGEVEEAARWARRGIARDATGAIEWTGVRCLPTLVGALRRLGRYDDAIGLAEEGIELCTRLRTPYEHAQLLDERALLLGPEARTQSRELLHQSLALREEFILGSDVACSFERLAALEADDGHLPLAARLLGAAETARERSGCPRFRVDRDDHERLADSLESELGDDFDAHWSEWREVGTTEVVRTLQRGRGPRDRPAIGWESLSPTERDVAELVASGLTNPEVAQQLFMSRSTVKTHLSRVYQKLGVTNRTELAGFAAARG